MTEHTGLPVAGYRAQSREAVAQVNSFKVTEEKLLRILDGLAKSGEIDKRWLAIGRTNIEQGFMAINRSVFQPSRAALSHDPEDKSA